MATTQKGHEVSTQVAAKKENISEPAQSSDLRKRSTFETADMYEIANVDISQLVQPRRLSKARESSKGDETGGTLIEIQPKGYGVTSTKVVKTTVTTEVTKTSKDDSQSSRFACLNCDNSLTGQRYIVRDEHRYCIKCYESVFANRCERCDKKIGIDFKDLSYKDRHWHEECFFCQNCKTSLGDAPFSAHNEDLFCGPCYEQKFAARCYGCGDVFKSGMKKMEYKGQQWHEHCFVCVNCKKMIGTENFIPKENKIHCVPCYEDLFGTKCTSCKKIISAGGVTYRDNPYHRECFLCTNCQKQLAGMQFTAKQDKPYCADCFGDLFAKKCTSCSKPISSMGTTKFVSFEKRNWHNACFNCDKCKASLMGKGFVPEGDKILCPTCGQVQKVTFTSIYTKTVTEDLPSGRISCFKCGISLTGQRYIQRDDHNYCSKCFQSVFANTCEKCDKKIGIEFKDLTYKDRHWHEQCFVCHKCKTSLVDAAVNSRGGEIFCGSCYEPTFSTRCYGCNDVFKSDTKKVEYKGQRWHEQCFVCVNCKNMIGNNNFIPKDNKIHCLSCYEDLFGTKCTICKKIISVGGVTNRGNSYHRECFLCANCQKQLAGVQFTTRQDKQYCVACFGDLFAKKCASCRKGITGMGGSKFVSFEQRHWHNECFICSNCQVSLLGQGFVTEGDEILCPKCGQA